MRLTHTEGKREKQTHTYTAYSAEICSGSSRFKPLPEGDLTPKTHPDRRYARKKMRKDTADEHVHDFSLGVDAL